MATDSVKVAVRVRPQNNKERGAGYQECTTVSKISSQIMVGNDKSFTYDYVFDRNSTQSEVYGACIQDLVAGVFQGFNATTLAYGQTGSGKTFTMGTSIDSATGSSDLIGIIPRAVDQIFRTIQEMKTKADAKQEVEPRFTIEVQFIELYNEEIIDLLAPDRSANVKIHEDLKTGQIVIKNAMMVSANSSKDILDILKAGSLARTTGSTNMNQQSSRSHAIFAVHVKQERFEAVEGGESVKAVLTAKLNFVDLAGSERLKKTGATGDRAKEGIFINGGLLALGNVISALTKEAKKHVPYRDSKLTRLLQDSLGGNSRTLMIACVSPNNSDQSETLNTLIYAARAKDIVNTARVNKEYETTELLEAKARIAELERELASEKQKERTVQVVKHESSDDVKSNMVEALKKMTDSVLSAFTDHFNSAVGNKSEIDELVVIRDELIKLSDGFCDGLENVVQVLKIPSYSLSKRKRRDTIFNENRTSRKRYTTLIAVPDERDENSPVQNNENMTDVERLKAMEQEIASLKERNQQLEETCQYSKCNSEAVIHHLSKSIRELKDDMARSMNN